jgi:large repetitive protein
MPTAAARTLIVGLLLVAAIGGGLSRAASAGNQPVDLLYACAQQGNGRMHAASSPNDCHPRREDVVTFSVAVPVTFCAKDGTVRLGPCNGQGTTLRAPSTTPVFFCAETSNGNLRRVGDPAECATNETAFVVVDHPPTDIALSNASVAENQPVGTTVGTLSATDQDLGDSQTFALVAGPDGADNASFQITGTTLKTNAVFDFETRSSYSIRVRATDLMGLAYEEALTISVTDVVENHAPTDIALSNASVNENQAVGTGIGTLSATDPDSGDTHTFSLVAGAGDDDNGSFQIDGATLETNAIFNFETKSSYSIRVRVTDSGSLTFEEQFTVSILDANDPPTAVADSYGNAVGNTLALLGTTGTGPHVVLTGNVLTGNDTDEDGDVLTAVAETVASTGGGTATFAADGSFSFLPGAGDKNQVDTFTYQVTDGEAQSAGTVSVTIADVLVWYVDVVAAGGDGRSSSPFNSLASLNGAGGVGDADAAGDVLFLYNGTYGGGLPLETGQKLTGQPHGLVVDPGTGSVTLVEAGGTNPTLTGAGIVLANDVEVQRVDVSNPTGAGISGTAITNATVGQNTSISGASGNAFELSGAAAGTIAVGSAISSSTGRPISVQDRSAGSVTFAGNVTGTGQGILLSSNTGATITLGGALTLSTGTNAAFQAAGGGTIVATGATNTLATTTGTALTVSSTTIGAAGLRFRSIASNGAGSGIVLSNTGLSGGLAVTGTGTAGTGGSILSSSGPGISLAGTKSPSFAWMSISGGRDDGIRGEGVNGFTLANTTLLGNGNAAGEHGIDFLELAGTASISGSSVNSSASRHFSVTNGSGSLAMTVTGTTFSNTSAANGDDGIHVDANGSAAIDVTVTGSTFTNNRGDHFQFATNAASSGSSSVTLTNNTLVGAATNVGAGIALTTDGSSQTGFAFGGNSVQSAVSSAITVDLGASSTATGMLSGTISGNTIGNPATPNSGSAQGNGITVHARGAGTLTASISSNQIREYARAGLDARIQSGSPTLNATVTGNTISDPGTAATNGLVASAGDAAGDGGLLCAGISGNSLTGSGANGGTDFHLHQRFDTTFRLPGYLGTADNTAAVVAFVQGNNGGTPSGTAIADFPASGGGFVGGDACQTP